MKKMNLVFGLLSDMITRYYRRILFISCFILLFGVRAFHMTGPIDDPHSWRQCDTANYALDFYRNGIDLLKPSVCWMGDYKTVILEFPFPEALMALGYKIFGVNLFVARSVTLLFFAGAAIYFYLIVTYLFRGRLALIATAVYMVLPLSIFYSRAVHVDFSAVFFAHVMTYYLIRGYDDSSIKYTITAMMAGCLAFLIKAPYVFYFVIPISVLGIMAPKPKNLIVLCAGMVVPVLIFLLWRFHVAVINEGAPDWFFIPGYLKFVNMSNWYYGPFHMRWNPKVWACIFNRFQYDIASKTGVWLFLLGLIASFVRIKSYGPRSVWFAWMWLGGLLFYLLLFFNLNYIHDYYQIPFLAIAAIFIGMAIDSAYEIFRRYMKRSAWLFSFCIYLVLAYNCIVYAQKTYFRTDPIIIEAGNIIKRATPEGSLVIAAQDKRGTDCRDPRLLYRAKRNGWSISKKYLSKELLKALRSYGAQYLTIVTPMGADVETIYGYQGETYLLRAKPWKVIVCKL